MTGNGKGAHMSEANREKRHKMMAHMDRRGEIVPGTSLAMGGDLISRKAAIDAITRVAVRFGITGEPQIMIVAKDAIHSLPTVQVMDIPSTSLSMGGDMIPRAEDEAMVAAAYEAAAGAAAGEVAAHGVSCLSPFMRRAIRALTPADARAALDRLIADRVAKAATPKLLVWWEDRRHAVLQRLVSESVLGEYRIETGWANGQVSLNVPGEPSQWHPNVEAAKVAAEENQICRIRAALKGGAQ